MSTILDEAALQRIASYIRQSVTEGVHSGSGSWSADEDGRGTGQRAAGQPSFAQAPSLRNGLVQHLESRWGSGKIWCVDCGAGQTPYGLLLSLISVNPELLRKRKSALIIATDANPRALSVAQAGIYPRAELDSLEPSWLERYFEPLSGRRMQIKIGLRQLVAFRSFNLSVKGMPLPLHLQALDAILAPDRWSDASPALQLQATTLFKRVLNPDGLLFLGDDAVRIDEFNGFQYLARETSES